MSISTAIDTIPISVDKQSKLKYNKPELVNGYKYVPDQYKNVAAGMEKQFAEFMIAQMENSVGSAETNSAANYYKSLMNSERAQAMVTKDQGLGLQKVILDQIYPQNLRNASNYQRFQALQDSRVIKKNDVQIASPKLEGKEPSNE